MICHVIRNFTSLGVNYKIGDRYCGNLYVMLSDAGFIKIEKATDDIVTQDAAQAAPAVPIIAKRGRGRPKKVI